MHFISFFVCFHVVQLFVPENGYESIPQPPTTAGYINLSSSLDTYTSSNTKAEPELEEEAQEEDVLGFNYALFWLAVITVVISYLSDIIVDSVKSAAKDMNISSVFLSAIVIPIIGNAAEHASAITFGYKNRLDLSLAIAVGSSTQIALLVLPLLAIVGWAVDRPMSFNFSSYETAILLLTIILDTFALKEGRSNWLLGLILLGGYGVIAMGLWSHTDETLE